MYFANGLGLRLISLKLCPLTKWLGHAHASAHAKMKMNTLSLFTNHNIEKTHFPGKWIQIRMFFRL